MCKFFYMEKGFYSRFAVSWGAAALRSLTSTWAFSSTGGNGGGGYVFVCTDTVQTGFTAYWTFAALFPPAADF